MTTTPITAVLFDLDGTLLDRRATFRHHLELEIGRHPELFAGADIADYINEALALDENGTVDRQVFYTRVEARFGLPAGAASLLRADFEAHYPEWCIPFRDVIPALAALKSRGLTLGVVTNGSVRIQTRKIDGLGIRPFLDCVLISESIGYRKPDRRIFDAALAELGIPAANAVFVGDNPVVDVSGAKQAGLHAIWKRDEFWLGPNEADLVIDEVCELPRVVEMCCGIRRQPDYRGLAGDTQIRTEVTAPCLDGDSS